MKNLNMQELDEQEKEVHISKLSDLIRVIKNGSTLLKLRGIFGVHTFIHN